jgi:hypothetical protein
VILGQRCRSGSYLKHNILAPRDSRGWIRMYSRLYIIHNVGIEDCKITLYGYQEACHEADDSQTP